MDTWKEEKETMTVTVVTGETGTGIRIADAETEETGTMIAAVDQSAVNQGWIPAPLFLFQVREPAAVKVHRVMTDGI